MVEIKNLQEKFDKSQSENQKLIDDKKDLLSECDILKTSQQRANSKKKLQCKCFNFFFIILVFNLNFLQGRKLNSFKKVWMNFKLKI